MREKPSAKQLAEAQTKRMEKELQLTEKQYKKVYSLYLREQKLRENLMSEAPMGGRPDGPGPGGQGMGRSGMGGLGNDSEMQKFQEQKEKKMRKILTRQQVSIWEAQEIRRDMEKSPLMDAPEDRPAR